MGPFLLWSVFWFTELAALDFPIPSVRVTVHSCPILLCGLGLLPRDCPSEIGCCCDLSCRIFDLSVLDSLTGESLFVACSFAYSLPVFEVPCSAFRLFFKWQHMQDEADVGVVAGLSDAVELVALLDSFAAYAILSSSMVSASLSVTIRRRRSWRSKSSCKSKDID